MGCAQTDLLTLAKEVAELKRVHAVGGDEPTLRDKPRWQVNSELPSTELRPGAEKQMLRPWEEEALPLVRRWLCRCRRFVHICSEVFAGAGLGEAMQPRAASARQLGCSWIERLLVIKCCPLQLSSHNAADTSQHGHSQAQVAVGNVFKRGAWWQRLAGGRRDFTFGICAPSWLMLSQPEHRLTSS